MQKNLATFGLAALLTGGPVLAWLTIAGSGEDNLRQVLRLSAWLAVLVYLLVFIARPLQQLSVSAFSKTLLANRRYVGIALAAVMTIHLVLLLVVNGLVLKVPGIIAYLLLYLMLFTSFDSARARLGARNWRMLHRTGLYVLGIAYLGTVGGAFIKAPLNPVYLTLTTLMVAALAIRITAYLKTRP